MLLLIPLITHSPTKGILGIDMMNLVENKFKNDPEEQATALGVPVSFLPVDQPLIGDVKDIKSWADYYKARDIPLHSPLVRFSHDSHFAQALVLDFPLTIFHLLKTFILPKTGGISLHDVSLIQKKTCPKSSYCT